MFKIISAELKKIVSKPGIYVLSILLAIILVLGAFIYNPKVQETSTFELTGETFLQKYDTFNQINADKKAESDANLEKAIKAVNNYTITVNSSTYTQKQYINYLIDKIEENYAVYQTCANDNSYQSYINTTRNSLVQSFKDLNNEIEKARVNSQEGSFTLLTSKSNHKSYKKAYNDVLAWAETNVQKVNLKDHIETFEAKYKNKFYKALDNFKYPTLSKEKINTYTSTTKGTRLYTLNQRLDSILSKIEENYQLATADKDNANTTLAPTMDKLANEYVQTIDTYTNLVKYDLISNAFSDLPTNEHLNTMYLSDYSEYNSNSLLAKYEYMFKHNKTDAEYAKPLTIATTSNDKINCYDFAYFVLRIFSFVIIVYAVMATCYTIAGEVKDGTMRYLAIRPVSRSKLLLGKWLSVLVMCIILMIFSAIISICVGIAVYGYNSQTILTIFNGTTPITLHPIAMIGIYLISMLFELIVYTSIALLLSTIIKSDLLGVTIMIMLYLLNILIPMFVQGTNTWLSFYPFSHISLYSLFGSTIFADTSNFFNLIFGAKVYAGTHVILTAGMIVILTTLTIAISLKIFNKKEL